MSFLQQNKNSSAKKCRYTVMRKVTINTVSSIILLPFHSPTGSTDSNCFSFFLGHVSFNFGTVCWAKLASSQLSRAH